jgi:hypothetical protein
VCQLVSQSGASLTFLVWNILLSNILLSNIMKPQLLLSSLSNNGHMIKFELFDAENSYQCHFASIGTFVVSIAHYMRAYFNYQALVSGRDFQLPGDAGYLNCILLQETAYADTQLYAKIGCMERETYTSTKLSLHVYTDEQCSVPFEDGENSRRHSAKGYEINGYTFGTRVSFRPPFYSCETCSPEEISDTFNKKSGTWYDDDYISSYGSKQKNNDDEEEEGDDAADDYYQDDYTDDAYLAANDDINNGDDDGGQNYAYGGDDYYAGDDGRRNLVGSLPALEAASGQLEVSQIHASLDHCFPCVSLLLKTVFFLYPSLDIRAGILGRGRRST